MSLSSVVSNLVRASIGTSASQVTDEDLDKHVAELILREAKKKAERFGQDGIRAYLRSGMSESNAPRTNKRFLSSIIRSTDDHNKTVLQAQAQAAQELKRERDEAERRERRARAEEAVAAEKLRRSRGEGSSRRRTNDTESWDHWDGRTAERPKRKQRAWETWTGGDEDEEDDERERERDGRRHRSRSRDRRRRRDDDRPSGSKHSRRERSSEPRDDDSRRRRHDEKRSSHRSHRKSRRRSSSRPSHSDDEINSVDSRSRPTRASSKDRRRRSRYSLSPTRSSTDETDDSRPRKRRRSVSPADSHSDRRRSRQISPAADDVAAREVELRQKLKSARGKDAVRTTESTPPPRKSKRDRSRSRERTKSPEPRKAKHERSRSRETKTPEPSLKRMKPEPSSSRFVPTRAPSRSPTPGPEPEIQLPSKMDKYFEESYDPRLDVAPLTYPKVPATGLISNEEFEGWDAMLQLIRIRKEDREEKKMMERLGLTKDKVTKTYKPITSTAVNERWSGEGSNIMEIEYNKRGSVREWDMGKEGF
ncbi:hypothetical protein C8R44DRAFT_883902 [Mycena epipterygia]|nr:hypothetical protein C8R44DRAFT_883902 [Mycena epipterygia]